MLASASLLMATMAFEPEQPHVLAGPGNRDRDVQVGCNGLSGQAHLVAGGYPTGVHRRPGSAHRSAKELGQLLQVLKRLWPAQPAPSDTTMLASSS